MNITVVGSTDRELGELLRACGATLGALPIAELGELAQPSAPQPDVVVLDLRPHPGVPPALSALTRQHPATGVVIVARTLDQDLILAAMRCGAHECVADPLTLGELEAAIARVMAANAAPSVSQSFAIISGKGGVGATSVAVNVATALSRLATSGTLLVDLHVARGDAALYLGVEPRFSVTEALDNVHKLDGAFFKSLVSKASSRLDLLAAPDQPSGTRMDPARVKALLDFTSKQFQFTVVDVPRTDLGVLDGLDSMTSIVVVTTQELSAVRGAAIVANRVRQRYSKDKLFVVLNRTDKQAELTPEDIEQAIGSPIAAKMPNDYRITLAALNKGRPLVLDNHNSLAAAFEKLARQLAGITVTKGARSAPNGWLGRLTGRK